MASGIGVILSKSLVNRKQLDIIALGRTKLFTVYADPGVLNVQYEGIGQLLAGGEGVAERPPRQTATNYHKRKKIANGVILLKSTTLKPTENSRSKTDKNDDFVGYLVAVSKNCGSNDTR